MRILVAEDDEGLRDVLVLGLTDAGYHVDAVERGPAARRGRRRDGRDRPWSPWSRRSRRANQGGASWIVAVSDATTASQLELSTERVVMSTGGFTGSDNALTLARLQALIASGELRFIVTGDSRGGPTGGASASSDVSTWVASACTILSVDGTATSVYDCAGAAAG